jgi:hypothetical protein
VRLPELGPGRTLESRCAELQSLGSTPLATATLRPNGYGHPPCERGANTSPTTRVHTRVRYRCLIPPACGAFVPSETRACPRFPRRNLNSKEGVDGSSPSEGSAKAPESALFLSARLARAPVCGGYGAVYGAFSSETASGKCQKLAQFRRIVLRRPSAVGRPRAPFRRSCSYVFGETEPVEAPEGEDRRD